MLPGFCMLKSRILPVLLGIGLGVGLISSPLRAEPAAVVTIQRGQPGARISSNLFGIFFEEINHAGDGGLYAELIRNRSFEEPEHLNSWQAITNAGFADQISADNSKPIDPANPWSMRLTRPATKGGPGVANSGFWGMNFKRGQTYDLTLFARQENPGADLIVRLENSAGTMLLAQGTISGLSTNWQQFSLSLQPGLDDPSGRVRISLSQAGTVWLDNVSLFPRNTFNGRTNGLRLDLAEKLADLKPAFVRFPGGCWVEGEWMTNAFRWKTTIGNPANRATRWNLWQYYSNNGLGYHEYLQFCEDLGADALFVVNCGMAHKDTIPVAQMDEYVQDALDAIEYANGPPDSKWGAVRAANGHPQPFKLRFLEIGNENGSTAYNERYALFYDAIKARYPGMRLIADVWGGTPTSRPLDIIDEHYYSDPAFFIKNAAKYDSYDRSGPKIYVGEYAVTSGSGSGNLIGALAEAVFMTGMERNSDVVLMASYAPLFANVNYKKWNPDLIYFDSSRVCLTPSYHVQQLFAANQGDRVLPVSVALTATNGAPSKVQVGSIGLGSWNTQVEYTNVVVSSNGVTLWQSDFTPGTAGWSFFKGTWETVNGLFRQTALITDCRAMAGSTSWTDYVLTLRARKTGGQEGFLIMFHWSDDNNWTWWNLGGWNNTSHALELCENNSKSIIGSQVIGQIETGRWYDIRIELSGPNIRCYLDNTLVHQAKYPVSQPLHVSASYKSSVGQTILKVVNVSSNAIDTQLALPGATGISANSTWTLLSADSETAENTIEDPQRVAPQTGRFTKAGTNFNYVFPAHSLTILRLQDLPLKSPSAQIDVPARLNDLRNFSNGIPVRLDSFITNDASVKYLLENTDGKLLASGPLTFVPGSLSSLVPTGSVLSESFLRVTLRDPVNCLLAANNRAYFIGKDVVDPRTLTVASYTDERLVVWNASNAVLWSAPSLNGPWTQATNAVAPVRVPRGSEPEFFRFSQ